MLKGFGFFLFLLTTIGLAVGPPFDTHLKFFLILGAIVMVALMPRRSFSLKSYGMVIAVVLGIWGLKGMLPISYIQEGGNVFVAEAIVQKQLPTPVYDYLFHNFKALYPQHKLNAPDKLYAFSVEQLYVASPLSRRIRDLEFSSPYTLRMGAMNANNLNTYNHPRTSLPYYLRYDFPKELVEDPSARLCWKGNLFVVTPDGRSHFRTKSLKCEPLLNFFKRLDQEQFTLYAAFVDPSQPLELTLDLPLAQKIYRGLEDLLSVIGWCLILLLLFPMDQFQQFLKKRDFRFKLTLFGMNLIFAAVLAFYYVPGAFDGFVLFAGDTTTHHALEALHQGNWKEFFQSSESIYDPMLWQQYAYALNLALFGETIFGYMLGVLTYPFVLYGLYCRLFGSLKRE